MFKIWASGAVTGSILCALQTSTVPSASALDRHIQIINNTRVAIVEIYLAQVGTGRWQQDLLNDDILEPDSSLFLQIDDGTGYCRFDMKTVFDDGTSMIQRNVNMCRMEGFAISYR
jgi:hypothetical protein